MLKLHLPQRVHKKRMSLLGKSVTISCIAHALLLSFFFWPGKEQKFINLRMSNYRLSDMPIQIVSSSAFRSASQSPATSAQEQKSQPQKAPVKKVQATTVVKQVAKPKALPTKKIAQAKPVAPLKKAPPKKMVAAQPEPKKEIKKPKKEEKKIPDVNPVAPVISPIEKPGQKQLVENTNLSALQEIIEEPAVIKLTADEYDIMCLYQDIQEEIERVWQKPAGIKPPRGCILKVHVDQHGKAKKVDVQESSTIITYDIAARMALSNAAFPARVANKELLIVFDI